MNPIIDPHSYGHDIEASWLLDRGLEILNESKYYEKISPITRRLADKIRSVALDNDSLYNECEKGHIDTRKIWWVQAEAVVGFLKRIPERSGKNRLSGCRRQDLGLYQILFYRQKEKAQNGITNYIKTALLLSRRKS